MCMSAQAVDTSHHATATSTRPCVQAHDNTLRRTVATVTRPCAQAQNNTSHCMAAMATRPRAQAHDNMPRCTAATTTRTGGTKTTKSSTKPRIHVTSHGIFISRRAKAMTTTTIGQCWTTRPCTQAHGILAIVLKRTCYASNIDATTSQATSNLDAHELHRQT